MQHGHEMSVLLLRQVEVDDVVVEVVFPVPRRDGDELATRRVHEYGPQRADFGGDVDGRHGGNLTARRSGGEVLPKLWGRRAVGLWCHSPPPHEPTPFVLLT